MDRHTLLFRHAPRIVSASSIVGRREKAGPLGRYFPHALKDDVFSQESFEKAERQMLQFVIADAVRRAPDGKKFVDILLAGDLMNQIVSSSFAAREFTASFCGLYGACSTMAEALALGATFVDGGYAGQVVACTGSHFGSVERQFRFPLELGTQRTPTAQWTVTGAGACLIGSSGNFPRILSATLGKVVDYGTSDANNMGAAMAPAARDTILTHFEDTGTSPADFDAVVTGDLGKLGSEILDDLCMEKGVSLGKIHFDCGAAIYSLEKENFQGGSGAGCSASVFASFIYDRLMSGEWKRILFVATGALLSPVTTQQGESIPCVAHAVCVQGPARPRAKAGKSPVQAAAGKARAPGPKTGKSRSDNIK